jgi:hypothetical protein
LILRAGIVSVRSVRIALAFAPARYLGPGVGDALLARLTPYFPGLPIMLVSIKGGKRRAYATFDTSTLLAELDLDGIEEHPVDLDAPPPDTREPPF